MINILMIITGIITVIVSVGYLPSTGGTVPQDMTLEQFQAQQQQAVRNSTAFKWLIAGCVIIGLGILMGLVRIYLSNQREMRIYNARVIPVPKPIVSIPEKNIEPTAPLPQGSAPIIYHEPIPYSLNTRVVSNTINPRWQNVPPKPILKVKRGPIVEII